MAAGPRRATAERGGGGGMRRRGAGAAGSGDAPAGGRLLEPDGGRMEPQRTLADTCGGAAGGRG